MDPISLRYEGEGVFIPAGPHWARQADKHFVIGQVYRMVEENERSSASHKHYFSCLKEGWMNLPDALLDEFPTPDALRKKMLIKAGYADETSIVCSSKAEALRIAAFVRPTDAYAIVTVRECVVRRFEAQSQSTKAMGRKVFQKSKEAVLNAIDDLLQVERGTMERRDLAA